MNYSNDNSLNPIQSSFDDDNDDAKEARFLDELRHIDFFAATARLGSDKAHYADPKAGNSAEYARKKARQFIQNSREKSFAFWQVFEAVYGSDLALDEWANIVHFEDEATTRGSLVGKLERALKMSSPQASKGFYERQLDILLESKKFQPVEQYLKRVYKEFTKEIIVSEVANHDDESGWGLHKTGDLISYPDTKTELLPDWDNLGFKLFGTKDALTQEMITTWLCGAVKRVLDPGCVMKRSLIIKGDQDAGKSAFARILAKSWGTELRSGTTEADIIRLCKTTWIMELSECDRLFKGKEASVLKSLLSTVKDTYIQKFKEADEASVTKRVTLFIGTTNESQFLVDSTGNKRFWVIDLADGFKLPLDWLEENIDQLWATAYHKFLHGHPTDLSEASRVASEVRNRDYMVEGSWKEQLETALAKATFDGKHNIAFKAVDIMYAMGLNGDAHSRNKTAVVNSLKQLGYEQKPIKVLGKTEKLWKLTSVLNSDVVPARIDTERRVWTYLDKEDSTKGYR